MLEFEQLLKVFFVDHGTKADALSAVANIRAWAQERNAENVAVARSYLAGTGPFPERAAVLAVVGRFLTDFADMVAEWADWAGEIIDTWPQDPSHAEPDWDTLRRVAQRGPLAPSQGRRPNDGSYTRRAAGWLAAHDGAGIGTMFPEDVARKPLADAFRCRPPPRPRRSRLRLQVLMRQFRGEASTIIDADPDAVFGAITDIDRLPSWNAVIEALTDRPDVGMGVDGQDAPAPDALLGQHLPGGRSWTGRSDASATRLGR